MRYRLTNPQAGGLLYFLKCSYEIGPYRMDRGNKWWGGFKLLYEIGLHCKVKITNGVFCFAAIYFSLH